MSEPGPPSVGILPIGALGAAFFYHLTEGLRRVDGDVIFLTRRSGDGSTERWKGSANLTFEAPSGPIALPLADVLAGDLPALSGTAAMPQIVLVCTNPDQIFSVLNDYVSVVEREHQEGHLLTDEGRLPALVLCSNGIYFQRTRSSFIELLEEATLLGRLPDLWPDLMPRIVGRLMRGVTIQTSVRRGGGADAVYCPGPRGRTRLTGGDRVLRAEVAAKLCARGGWFEDAGVNSPTRVEFDKALVNLATNVFGQLAAIDEAGRFRVLTVGEIVTSVRQAQIRELVEAAVRVGKGVGAYGPSETAEEIFQQTLHWLKPTASHVPSSIQWIGQQLATRTLRLGLAPTETWLLKPLQHYAKSLNDAAAIQYFERLEANLVATVARAVAAQDGNPGSTQ